MPVPKVSGNIVRNATPCTAPGSRSTIPSRTNAQLRQNANPMVSEHGRQRRQHAGDQLEAEDQAADRQGERRRQ